MFVNNIIKIGGKSNSKLFQNIFDKGNNHTCKSTVSHTVISFGQYASVLMDLKYKGLVLDMYTLVSGRLVEAENLD